MIWMSWRQFRPQAITAGALFVVLAVTFGITGAGLASDYNGAGLNSCHLACGQDATNFTNTLSGSTDMILFFAGIVVMYATPALIGLFWGAPLIARELETGTGRLVWNQSAGVPGQPGAWIISTGAVNAAGHPAGGIPAACGSVIPRDLGPGGSPALDHCLARHGIWVALSYQPLGRYWPLQFAETGLFLALALGLAGFCFWRLGRRPS